MKKTVLRIQDETNVRFEDLDPSVRRKLSEKSKYMKPGARFTPAYRLGRWDGKVAFCDIAGRTYLNYVDVLLPLVIEAGYEVELIDERPPMDLSFEKVDANSYSHRTWPADHPTAANQSITLKEHQIEYINSFLTSPQGIGVASTGAGKTIATAVLADKIGRYGRSILIVPSKDLVTQTERDYRLLGLDVGVYFGDRKEYNHQHTICTWQSLEVINKNTRAKTADCTIDEFLDGVAGVMVDECHKAKGDVLLKLLTGPFAHVPIRWGLTGTVPKEEWERVSLEVSIGQILGTITAKELQDKGVLAQLDIKIWQLQDYAAVYSDYHSEYTWLTTDKKRISFLAKEFEKISTNGNTLILVDRISTGELLQNLLPDSVFISGKVKSADRKDEYDEVKTATNKIIIATYGVASTGIDIPRIFNLVLMEPGKSFVRVIQSIGRGIRKAADKDFVQVYDVCSSAKYSKKHVTERKRFYKEAQYPFTVEKIEW